jgi:bla regulator protein blaR1
MELSNYLLKSVAILSIFYVVYYLFLRKDTLFTAKRHYLLSGILASLFLPFLEFTKTIYKEVTYVESISFSEAIPTTAQVAGHTQEAFIINWWQLALIVYAFGVLIMGGRLLIQIHSLYKLIRTHPSEKIEGFHFIKVDRSVSPFSFFKYIVYNPSLHTKEELQMILKHEQIHVSQWHSIDIIVANVVRILQWVNPFSWYYKKSLEENLEFIADNQTASRVPSKIQYQLTLVKASSPVHAPALTTQFYQSFTRLKLFGKEIILKKPAGQVKKRIIMLNKNTSKRLNIWKLSIVLPILALFLWSFNVREVVEYKEVTSPKSKIDDVENSKIIADGLPIAEKEPISTNIFPSIKKTNTNKGTASDHKSRSEESSITSETQVNDVLTEMRVASDPAKEFRFQITKNTTDAELENMKNELKTDHGIELSYTVARNSNKEITSISLSYTSENNNGSYNINGEGPIEDFHFYMTDDGESGFWSEENEIRREERALKRVKEMEERKVEREVRRVEMMNRRVEMMNRRVDMDDRRDEMDERRKEMIVLREEMKDRNREMIEREKEIRRRYVNSSKAYGKAKTRSNSDNNVFVFSGDDDNVFNNAIMINKDTTDDALKKIKTKMMAEGITFNYSKVKRNEDGEITRIKITTDNGKGRKSTISIIGDDNEAIEEIFIEI